MYDIRAFRLFINFGYVDSFYLLFGVFINLINEITFHIKFIHYLFTFIYTLAEYFQHLLTSLGIMILVYFRNHG